MTTTLCPECSTMMTRGERLLIVTFAGMEQAIMMPGWYCPACKESLHDGKDMKVSDRALNLLKARAAGLLVPADIRRIRRSLHLTQREAGEVIGGGPNAFQKYEAGDIVVSQAMSNLLTLLDHDGGALSRLSEAQALRKAG